jgi:hypothetical protein
MPYPQGYTEILAKTPLKVWAKSFQQGEISGRPNSLTGRFRHMQAKHPPFFQCDEAAGQNTILPDNHYA